MLEGKQLSNFTTGPQRIVRGFDKVNHVLLSNKDGRYAWRPLELIHPALYVSLVNAVTSPVNWNVIRGRFRRFRENRKIVCLSLPIESLTEEKDKAELVKKWWQDVEQRSIELSLDFDYMVRTDIVDCYASMYTHSVSWALHSKLYAKEHRRDNSLIGNIIDNHLQDMRQGQTNGIPQGSVLMDLIGEMVLGYADTELTVRLKEEGIENYRILRCRDDYRIFVAARQDGERILKCLTEVMIDLGLKLNPNKTQLSSEVIQFSIKDDKLNWMFRKQTDQNLQRRLLIIHDHGLEHPNSGSLDAALNKYNRHLRKIVRYDNPLPLVGIVADIAFRNPRTYPIASAILSKLMSLLETDEEKRKVVSQLPNTGHMDIWIQRICHSLDPNADFDEPLCKLVSIGSTQIWNNSWIDSPRLKSAIDPKKIISQKTLRQMSPIVSDEEVDLFKSNY